VGRLGQAGLQDGSRSADLAQARLDETATNCLLIDVLNWNEPHRGSRHAAAAALNVAPSTLHRWLNDGLVPGEQVTPGAPWRIRMTDELKAKFTEAAGDGFITMQEATRALGVTRQTVLQRVKRGEIEAAHVTKGGKRGLRINKPGGSEAASKNDRISASRTQLIRRFPSPYASASSASCCPRSGRNP